MHQDMTKTHIHYYAVLLKGHFVKSCAVIVFVLLCDLDSYQSITSRKGLSYNVEIHGKHLNLFFHYTQHKSLQTN